MRRNDLTLTASIAASLPALLVAAAREAALVSRQHLVRHLDAEGKAARYHGGARGLFTEVNLLVWHATAGDTLAGAWSWLDRLVKAGEGVGSYHYGIEKDGTIHRKLGVGQIAYHAGVSEWPCPVTGARPHRSVNRRSIGIAFANDNGSDRDQRDDPLTYDQMVSGLWLGRVLAGQFPALANPLQHVGHREVAPGRKTDPIPRCVQMAHWRGALGITLTVARQQGRL